jgi:hypothetical protein
MDRIHRADLRQLVDWKKGPCVSLFMPMHLNGRDGTEDPIRVRKTADEAEERLIHDYELRRTEAALFVAPLRDLLLDAQAWNQRGQSIAFFAANGFHRMFHVAGELEACVCVDDHLHVLPLLPLTSHEERFFVLAISQNVVRFFEGNAERLQETPLARIPKNLKEAIDIEDAEHGQRYHSGNTGSLGKQMALHHGQGGKPDTIKGDLRQFLRQIAAVVDQRLKEEGAPLVLATVEATVPMWREVSDYKFLLDDFVAGSPDHTSVAELHVKAWPLVQPALAGHRKWCERQLLRMEGAKVASSLRDIVPAAISGRVAALFIDCKRSRWGQYDAANHAVVLHREREDGDQDLVELAAIETMKNGGDVFDLRPEESGASEPAEALLRF